MRKAMMSGSFESMEVVDDSVEQRIFELLGEHKMASEIADELGMGLQAAVPVILKVLRERGTPQSVELDRSLDRLAALAERI